MKATFIARLHDLKVTESLGYGDKLFDTLKITNDRSRIEGMIPESLKPSIGHMEFKYLCDGAPVVYSEEEIPEGISSGQYLVSRLYDIQLFLMTSWVYRDNSINFELGFLFYESDGNIFVDSNSIAHHYTKSDGKHQELVLSRDELREIRRMHRGSVTSSEPRYELPTSSLTAKFPRYARANYFINAARGALDIAIKVANYCAAFETLFSHSQNELSHQMAERIAFYLFTSPEDRLKNYRRIKSAYGLRSKVVHGSTISEGKLAEAVDISRYCDDIARMIFARIYSEGADRTVFALSGEEFEEEMLSMIFGGAA